MDTDFDLMMTGIKGPNFLSCDSSNFEEGGDNILSVVYVPGRNPYEQPVGMNSDPTT